jgi:hypothetical protein
MTIVSSSAADFAPSLAALRRVPALCTEAHGRAWSPPVEAYRYAEDQGLVVDAKYCETGMDFIGRYGGGVEATMMIGECEDEELRDCFAFAFEEWDDG